MSGCGEFSAARKSRSPIRRRGAFVSRSRALSRLRSQSRSRRWQPLIPVLVPRGEPAGLRLHVESLPVLISLRPPNPTNPGWHCMVTNTLRHVFRRTSRCRVPTIRASEKFRDSRHLNRDSVGAGVLLFMRTYRTSSTFVRDRVTVAV